MKMHPTVISATQHLFAIRIQVFIESFQAKRLATMLVEAFAFPGSPFQHGMSKE
jgi:hypothetical protein